MLQTKVRSRKSTPFPLTYTFFMHSSDNDNYFQGQKLKLSGETLVKFTRIGYEVQFELQINEDGSNKVLSINNVNVSDKNLSI